MICIEPLGTEVVLPAVVIGYELGIDDAARVAQVEEIPNWFLELDQQAGGYNMSYPDVGGVVLRLTDNTGHLNNAGSMIAGFKAMAEDPQIKILRRSYPDLAKLVWTWGDPYPAADLQRLHGFLSKFGRFPAVAWGIEAFVKFERSDLLATFGGWHPLHATAPIERQEAGRLRFDECNINELQFDTGPPFSKSHLSTLQIIGQALGNRQPEAFFLWENSD